MIVKKKLEAEIDEQPKEKRDFDKAVEEYGRAVAKRGESNKAEKTSQEIQEKIKYRKS